MKPLKKEQPKTITKCTCGCENFLLDESLGWKGWVYDEGELQLKNFTNSIESIVCQDCGKAYSEDEFKSINFN